MSAAAGSRGAPQVHRRHLAGAAGPFHQRRFDDAAGVEVWAFEPTAPALVLGSRQDLALADAEACAAAGVEVVRRRSGGGAVLVVPGEIAWLDVVVARTSPWWTDDVVEAMVRCGDAWRWALTTLDAGLAPSLVTHRGRLDAGVVGEIVCFGGIGPGEVTAAGAKLVGISQRRTRSTARLQCMVHRSWEPDRLIELLAPGAVDEQAVRELRVASLPVPAADLADEVAAAIAAGI